jgi:superfamily II DNA or RNA helicase
MKLPDALWAPQKEAYDKIHEYIIDFKEDKTKASCLIKMPTGSGKTGVITCIAHLEKSIKSVLVISPRDVLRTQLFEEINTEFFKKIDYSSADLKKVIKLTAGNDFNVSHLNKIVVTTIQKLNITYTKSRSIFDSVCKKFDLIIFDEGHYAPATSWSITLREIKAPKIIFTATPFRNDLKKFEFDSKYIYSITQKAAQNLKILRTPEFIPINIDTDPIKFIETVLKEFDEKFASDGEARLIIRCEDYSSILKIANIIKSKKISFVCIHERFQGQKEKWKYKKVPPKNIEARIWIHQFKLIEGFDDPRFKMLATYSIFKNSRQLIQQIGRVLRNPTKTDNAIAYILDNDTLDHKSIWDSYLDYDDQFKNLIRKTYGETLREVLLQLPNTEYIDRSFRTSYLENDIDSVLREIAIPLSCNVYNKGEVTISLLKSNLEGNFDETDQSFTYYPISDESGLYIHISYNNSPHLITKFFFNINLHISFFKIYGNHIGFYNSNGMSLYSRLSEFGLSLIETEKLKKLISNNSESRLTNVSLKNSNLGYNSISGHSYNAASIADVAPFLDDHGQVISSVIGYSKEQKIDLLKDKESFRRYLGFSNGKITQSNVKYKLEDYIKWLDSIIKGLSTTASPINIFNRYAKEIELKSEVKPKHILLDFSEIERISFKSNDIELDEYEVASEVTENKGKFTFVINLNSLPYVVEIKFSVLRKIFILESQEITQSFWNEDRIDLIRLLNTKQSFRVITDNKNIFYAFGAFYDPKLKFGSTFKLEEFQLRNIIIPVKSLNTTKDEKGKNCAIDGSGWDKNSMFHLIDTLCVGTEIEKEFENAELLICDDMGEEVADFILCTDKKVAFIHVKGIGNKPSSKVSATNLMDVCGQAVKNIEYLSMFNDKKPSGVKSKWQKEWSGSRGVKGKVKDRLRFGTFKNSNEIWDHIHSRISDPSIDNEVWLFLGGILSRNELIKKLKKDQGNSAALQTLVLLNGTLTNVGALGCKLKIFCSE